MEVLAVAPAPESPESGTVLHWTSKLYKLCNDSKQGRQHDDGDQTDKLRRCPG